VDSACPVPFPLPSVNSNVSRQATAVIDLRQEPVADLREHAAIPSRFEAATVYDVSQSHSGFELVEREMSELYRKNYDAFEDPLTWPRTFNTAQWILLGAFAGAQRVGGAIVATATPGVDLLEGRSDLAVVWDLRVAPAYRRQSVAAALLDFAQVASGWHASIPALLATLCFRCATPWSTPRWAAMSMISSWRRTSGASRLHPGCCARSWTRVGGVAALRCTWRLARPTRPPSLPTGGSDSIQ
jgi:ribosomal protein S18 acetylase RimI-like enzyme